MVVLGYIVSLSYTTMIKGSHTIPMLGSYIIYHVQHNHQYRLRLNAVAFIARFEHNFWKSLTTLTFSRTVFSKWMANASDFDLSSLS